MSERNDDFRNEDLSTGNSARRFAGYSDNEAEGVSAGPSQAFAQAAGNATPFGASRQATPFSSASRQATPFSSVNAQEAYDGQPAAGAGAYGPSQASGPSPYAGTYGVPQPGGTSGGYPPPPGSAFGSGQPPYGAPADEFDPSKGKATAALVCGILSIVFSGSALAGIVLGVVAIVLAGKYFKDGGTAGTAKAGRVCGIVGIVFSVLAFMAYLSLGFATLDLFEEGRFGEAVFESPSTIGDDDLSAYNFELYLDNEDKAVLAAGRSQLDKLVSVDPATVDEIAARANEGFATYTGYTLAECGVDPAEYARGMLEGFSYVADSAYGDEETRTGLVTATAHGRDVYDVMDDFIDDLGELGSSGRIDSMTEDELKQFVGTLLMEAIRDASYEDDIYIGIDMVKQADGTWVADPEDWASELDYTFCM